MKNDSVDIEKLGENFNMGAALQALEMHYVPLLLETCIDCTMEWNCTNEGNDYWHGVATGFREHPDTIAMLTGVPRKLLIGYVTLFGGKDRIPTDVEARYNAAVKKAEQTGT